MGNNSIFNIDAMKGAMKDGLARPNKFLVSLPAGNTIGNDNKTHEISTILKLTIEHDNKTTEVSTILKTTIENFNKTYEISRILKLTIENDNKTHQI